MIGCVTLRVGDVIQGKQVYVITGVTGTPVFESTGRITGGTAVLQEIDHYAALAKIKEGALMFAPEGEDHAFDPQATS